MLTHPNPRIPRHHHQNMTPNTYPSIPLHPICFCPYSTSVPIYVPYVVQHYPHITSSGYLHETHGRLYYCMLPKLFPPRVRDNYPNMMK